MPSWIQRIIEWVENNPGKSFGLLAGLGLFVLLALLGPWFLLFTLLVGGGFIYGKSLDENITMQEVIRNWMDKWKRQHDDDDDL